MKIFNYLYIIFALVFIPSFLFGGPYLKINSIDYSTDFPNIQAEISLRSFSNTRIDIDDTTIHLYEDGYRVNYYAIEDLSTHSDYIYLVFSVDCSKSISLRFFNSLKKSANEIVNITEKDDSIAVYSFADKVHKETPFISNKEELQNIIDTIKQRGTKTLLYDAVYDSLELLPDQNDSHRAVIVFTDGKDEGSSVRIDDIADLSEKKSIPIHFITFKNSNDIKNISRIAKLSGGTVFYSNNIKNITGMYKSIISSIKNRYLLKYKSNLENDGKKHTLKIKLNTIEINDTAYSQFILPKDFLSINKEKIHYFLHILTILLLIFLFLYLRFSRFQKQNVKNMNGDSSSGNFMNNNKTISSNNSYSTDDNDITADTLNLPSTDIDEYADSWLVYKNGNMRGKKIMLKKPETTIGSGNQCDITLSNPGISSAHSKIKISEDKCIIFDLISENGTYLNGSKLLRPKVLYDWDEIRISDITFIFRGSSAVS